MRYEKGHKDETRRRIVETAARRFRKDGIAATGIAGLMADAGLTHGGFYAHFPSKEDLVRQAVDVALTSATAEHAAAAAVARAEGGDGLEIIVRRYLSRTHRDHPETGCAIATLAAELARSSAETRGTFAQDADQLIQVIAAEIPAASAEEARASASMVLALMVGALQLARAMPDAAASDAMLQAGRRAALALARQPAS
ncbi:TetR/AcrR family transcriptional regulator [Bosea caraganae]|uniref:TetR/AcrR family transcriptional regulator n=1 Tax=Bosea caraganae TaxID=2763117 RepID=A0A370L3E4_9HYPH|nr:TetR/AcrR family transcriptional regulator [Bosea caraganae]RDJ22216.1 TetR/AcrR family transcriptional regulator [Bosea caraganae]RDJ22697.1 TetR/AcrR family transcriptional regulator [Bosea caraganae]